VFARCSVPSVREAEWKRLVRPLLDDPEQWAFRGSLCYRRPISRFLCGALVERSGSSKASYIWRVTVPLFIPHDVIVLSWSQRVGDGAHRIDDTDEDTLRSAISTALLDIEDESAALRRLGSIGVGPNIHVEETAAHALILLGDTTSAAQRLGVNDADPDDSQWVHDDIARMRGVANLLDARGRDAAIAQLDRWVDQTSAALGITR